MMTRELEKDIFVFGSNLAGIHGAGAALYAVRYHKAVRGIGEGIQGSSYSIPTKDESINTLPLYRISEYVDDFLAFAKDHPELHFNITAIGCGLAGYSPEDIAPMFKGAIYLQNCTLPAEFKVLL